MHAAPAGYYSLITILNVDLHLSPAIAQTCVSSVSTQWLWGPSLVAQNSGGDRMTEDDSRREQSFIEDENNFKSDRQCTVKARCVSGCVPDRDRDLLLFVRSLHQPLTTILLSKRPVVHPYHPE